MRIALLSVFYPYRGGIAQFGAMLYRVLEKDHELKAYTFSRQYPNILFPGSSQYVNEKDHADEIPAERLLDSVNPISYRKTAKEINLFTPDLFISQYWMTFFGPSTSGVQKRLKKGTKRISILHNVIPHEKRFFDGYANKKFLKENEGFVVMSDIVERDLLSVLPNAKYIRIDHPVYSQFGARIEKSKARDNLKLDKNKKYLLFFGFIRAYKGLDLLLESLSQLPKDYEVIVAGEIYGSFDIYQKIIDNNSLQSRVHLFNEYISDDEVGVYFSASDVCVLPYKNATQSGITAISHHFDLPIVATDVGGLKETVGHNKLGWVVDPNIKSLTEGCLTIFENDRLALFSKNIQQHKKQNSWENFAERIIAFSQTV